ncbi:alpha/beta hydrolase [Curvibacter sp. HBC28]|uniref:Alpha/beta hydrolase n=1 Tax=Curvibacter microcysteis TaxID=3026419 RepID=A0ABT5MHX2_9BURK|nr:alpha/beta hydrolase [Curvibacter sp. HBC28]MDD0814726.1 alpha/beta hydrolase [Curvibacter sp. HBC28]
MMNELYPGPTLAAPALPDWVQQLAQQARRVSTSCGDGDLVWHVWGQPREGVPPLVLFHGGSGSWTHFVRNIEALVGAGRELWVPDLPGFGDSAVSPLGGDADAMVEPLYEGLRSLLGPRPCDLLGFSFGGMTAGLLLAAHPELASRLVLVGAPAMGVVPQRQFELKAWRHLLTPEAQADIHRYNLAALMLHDTTLIEGLALQVHAANVRRDRLPRRRLAHTDILARSLPSVSCPVWAIYGEHDALYKSWITQLASAFEASTPDFRGLTLVPEAGHWVQFERPEAFHSAVLAALG